MKTDAPGRRGRSFWRGGRRVVLLVIMIIAVLAATLRLAAPTLVTKFANRKLSELPDYIGRISGVELAILRGVVHVRDFTLTSRKKPGDEPEVKIPRAMLTVEWRPLLQGKIAGRAVMERSELVVFNDEPVREEDLSQEEERKRETEERVGTVEKARAWQELLREAFPMEISRLEMRDTRIRFVDRAMNPPPEIVMEGVSIVATGLTNRPAAGDELPASLEVKGGVKTGGRVSVDARFNPVADQPRFTTKMKVEGLALPPLNHFARYYGKADVESGRFTVFVEADAEGGRYQGYVQPFFEDLSFKAVQEEKNVLKRAATKVADAVASVLESEEEKVATQIPIQGNFTDNDVDIWTTIRTLMRNAFVQALREGFAGQKPSD